LVAAALGPLLDRLVFVGGCAAGLLMDEPGATRIRATLDVDLVAQVTALPQYHDLEVDFTRLGFSRDMAADAPICRWTYRGIRVDLMPSDAAVLGFANSWYPLALETAKDHVLPSGAIIRLISPAAFLATKFEAFADRGQGDLLGSHDLEDVVNVVASRTGIVAEVRESPARLRAWLAGQCGDLLAKRDFESYLPGLLLDDSYGEMTNLVLARLHEIAGIDA
jgi:hypothetical protein